MDKNYAQIIRNILNENVMLKKNAEEILVDDDLYSVGLDSINSVNFALAIENHFGIMIKDEHITGENFSSIQKVIDLLQKEYL